MLSYIWPIALVIFSNILYHIYHEALTWNKLVGVVICLLGLFFINLR